MNWILGIACWLFLAGLLLYLCVWIDYRFFLYDLLERRAAKWVKHPYRVLAILCLLLSANIILFSVKIITIRQKAIEAHLTSFNKKLTPTTLHGI